MDLVLPEVALCRMRPVVAIRLAVSVRGFPRASQNALIEREGNISV